MIEFDVGTIILATGFKDFNPIAKRAVFLSIATIVAGFLVIAFEIENSWRMPVGNVIGANPTSNIWWMGTLYGLAVGFVCVEFFLIITKQYRLAIILGVFGAFAEMAANSCLGGVFATLAAHPFWYGSQLPVYFLCCAFMSGAAAAILFTNMAFKIRNREIDSTTMAGMQSAGKVLTLTLFLVCVATAWRFISFFVGGAEGGRIAAMAMTSGPLSFNFWVFEILIGLAFPLGLLAMTKLKSAPAMALAAFMTLVGQFFSRYDLVVGGQLVPHFSGWDNLPTYFSYVPSVSEFMVTFGGIGVVGATFLLGERFFGRAFDDHGDH